MSAHEAGCGCGGHGDRARSSQASQAEHKPPKDACCGGKGGNESPKPDEARTSDEESSAGGAVKPRPSPCCGGDR